MSTPTEEPSSSTDMEAWTVSVRLIICLIVLMLWTTCFHLFWNHVLYYITNLNKLPLVSSFTVVFIIGFPLLWGRPTNAILDQLARAFLMLFTTAAMSYYHASFYT